MPVSTNNGSLGFIDLEQKSFLDFETELNNPNFAAMAQAIGIDVSGLETPRRSILFLCRRTEELSSR
jgi:thiamine pyrophosphate-dependent acetolactate synthase large subunit-like protein